MKAAKFLELAEKHNIKSSNAKSKIKRHKLDISLDLAKELLESKEKKEAWLSMRLSNKKKAKAFKMSLKEYTRLYEKAEDILGDFGTGHSMGCVKKITIKGRIFCQVDETEKYARSCKWQPAHGSFAVSLTRVELGSIEKIDNLWTIPGADNKCTWLGTEGSKSTYIVVKIRGFLVGSSHGSTLREARLTHLRRTDAKAYKSLTDDRFVGLQYFIDRGACRAGIAAFIQKHSLNKDFGYRLGYLRTLESNSFLIK